MKKWIIIIAVVLVLGLVGYIGESGMLNGLGGDEQQEEEWTEGETNYDTNDDPYYNPDEAAGGNTGAYAGSVSYLSQEEASQLGGVYVLRGAGEFYPIDGCELRYGAATTGSVDTFGVTRDDDSNLVTLGKNDQLVTFDSSSYYEIDSVYKECYILPIKVSNVTSNGMEFSGIGPLLDCEYHHYTEEIEGSSFTSYEELESVLKSQGARFFSDVEEYGESDKYIGADFPMTLKGAYYDGTDYMEYNLVIDAKCYTIYAENEVPVQRTQNGYFVIDCSTLGAGRYVVEVGGNYPNKYLIDIA